MAYLLHLLLCALSSALVAEEFIRFSKVYFLPETLNQAEQALASVPNYAEHI